MAKPHSQDILLVRNIDVDCDQTTYDVIPAYRKEKDEETGEEYQRFDNYATEFNHRDYFAVRWAGQEHKIKPGQERMFPRFIAEHYAKHLTDHILGKREVAEKKTGLATSAIERPKVIEQILVRVVQRFEDDGPQDEGLEALAQVHELNRPSLDLGGVDFAQGAGKARELGGIDAGEVPNKVAGVLTTEAPQSVDDVLRDAGEIVDKPEVQELPSRQELIKEAHALGIKVTPTDTRESLAAKIKQF